VRHRLFPDFWDTSKLNRATPTEMIVSVGSVLIILGVVALALVYLLGGLG